MPAVFMPKTEATNERGRKEDDCYCSEDRDRDFLAVFVAFGAVGALLGIPVLVVRSSIHGLKAWTWCCI